MEVEELDSVNHGTETLQLEGSVDHGTEILQREGSVNHETETLQREGEVVIVLDELDTDIDDYTGKREQNRIDTETLEHCEDGMEFRPNGIRMKIVGDTHSNKTETEDGMESGQVDRETTLDLGEEDDDDSTHTIKLEGDKEATNNEDKITKVVRSTTFRGYKLL